MVSTLVVHVAAPLATWPASVLRPVEVLKAPEEPLKSMSTAPVALMALLMLMLSEVPPPRVTVMPLLSPRVTSALAVRAPESVVTPVTPNVPPTATLPLVVNAATVPVTVMTSVVASPSVTAPFAVTAPVNVEAPVSQ
eukprot:TRINITY_DN3400_c0_g1_i5.p1 TRINITY_DN3400_c0_g1~~TRINITY_DN3400_c0_g1_i5.p1  ORF type:complete len:138 (-),score=22.32 TRINITY_DN3400_c0_g1_i5:266-679(-)